MEQSRSLKAIAKDMAVIVQKNDLTYDQTRKVFQYIRKDLKLATKRKPMKLPVVLTDDELDKLLHTAYDKNPKYGLALSLMAKVGLRVSEVVKLQIQDIMWKERKAHIKNAKGHKDRMVLLPKTTTIGLHIYIKSNQWKEGPIFRNKQDTAMTTRYINKIVIQCCNEADINKQVTPHTLRHTFATNLLNKGMPLMGVKKLLGHASVTSTEIYTHISLKDILNKFRRATA